MTKPDTTPGTNSTTDGSPAAATEQRSIAELETQITELAGHLDAGSYRWLVLIAEFDRRKGWDDGSTPSCAHWLAWKCGLNAGAARERVRVARALEKLPQISAAMGRGALSFSKVRAISRIATAENEDTLLTIALHGTAHNVETLVRLYRQIDEAHELGREAMQQANRGASWFYDDDGSLVLRARLPAETGALLVKALELATEDDRPLGVSDVPAATFAGEPALPELAGSPATPYQRRADALGLFAETWLSHGSRSLDDDRQQIVVHVDRDTLREEAAGRCEIEGGPAVAVQTARRLSCDATLVSILEDGEGQPLDVGRKTRIIPPAIRRALRSRDPGCRFPGCTHTRFLDGHHLKHWADGGETKLSNLLMLCRFHHRQVHEGRVRIQVLDDGALQFTGRRGQHFVAAPSLKGDADQLVCQDGNHAIYSEGATAEDDWQGPINYGIAIKELLMRDERRPGWRRDRPRDVPAGTS